MTRSAHAPVLGTLERRPIALPAALLLGLLAALAGCQNRRTAVIPNRVLDRPLDVVLACVRRDEDGRLIPQSLDQCSDAVAESVCGDLRLLGFVANSERNDIAMFSRCSGAVIDMNIGAPGPQLISAGEVPSSMTITTGAQAGCFAISANLGSCDLSVLDVGGLASYAFEEPPEDDPAGYVTTVVPRRADGTPLGARPGQVIAVPPALSNAATGDQTCDPAYPGSVYVTFPSCQLVAELDLRTQRILQSRQFVRDDQGAITVVDAGADPVCPIDCSEQFLDPMYEDALKTAPVGDPDGMYPLAMALVTPPSDPTGCVDDADLQVQDPSLYVGGLGADALFELRFDGKTWTDDPLEFELTASQGISAIRPTPAMEMNSGLSGDNFFQFLYILAGDGSTRVVRRNFDPGRIELGIECDTQVDPTAVTNTACHPAEFPGENPPDRRPFARGPGIRAPSGAIITDWAFQKWHDVGALADGANADRCPAGLSTEDAKRVISSPFEGVGVVGVGTTSFGRLVFGVFNQFTGARTISTTTDQLGLLDARVPPHSLWPQLDPFTTPVEPSALPRMDDKEPQRLVPGDITPPTVTRRLSPSLRRIDNAYELRRACSNDADCDGLTCEIPGGQSSGYCETIGPALSPPVTENEQDKLAALLNVDDTILSGLYREDVVRAVVRDYAAWEGGEWNLYWEGEIPNTRSANGQLVCATPGWQDATCLSTVAGDTRMVDQTAQFCDEGVLAGDKLFLLGCAEDADCGIGQFCLIDNEAPAGSTGLCVSQAVFEEDRDDELRQLCRPFLRDECGAARREFLITRAFQSELWLQVLDRRFESYAMPIPPNFTVDDQADIDALCSGALVRGADGDACVSAVDNPNCGTDGQPACCQGDYDFAAGRFVECEARLSCGTAQPDNGCGQHSDCAQLDPNFPLCIDGVCRAVCGPDEDCALTPLPGPACFRELLRYQVNARNSFVVRGPGPYDFLPQRVKADPETGECFEDTTVSNLLTSRIRLGRDEEDSRTNALWPIPSCTAGGTPPDGSEPNPCFIDTLRPAQLKADTSAALYHVFRYGTEQDGAQPVPAIRYSNPMMSLVLDLTSLQDLTEPIPGTEEALWPGWAGAFRRSRIPGAFRESFSTRRGYSPYDAVVVTSNVSLVGPTRIVNAPELSTVFIVDSSGGSGGRGTRGQVVRVTLAGGQVNPDVRFLVR